jgi:predicted histidine transporter YuiF (NhaC family)
MDTKEEETIEFTPEQLVGWEEYRKLLYTQKSKSDDQFEKAITFITSGSLGLTITFHSNIVPVENAIYVLLIAFGWIFLVATLFVNLMSHYLSSKSLDKSMDEIDEVIQYKISFSTLQSNLNKRNKKIDNLNKMSLAFLAIGLILIIFYITTNIHYGKTTETQSKLQTTKSTTTQNQQAKSERSNDTTAYIPVK